LTDFCARIQTATTTTTTTTIAAAAAAAAAALTVKSTVIHRRLGISKVSTGTLPQGMENRNAVSL